MTLDEAIKHCEEKACDNTECSQEHKQLAEWLKELKQAREEIERFENLVKSLEDINRDLAKKTNIF